MELCECSLYDLVTTRREQIPYVHQLRIVSELCAAVAFAHAGGVLHRDIRPHNILLKQGGHEGTVKLADFGLSQEMPTRMGPDASVSVSAAQVGTEIASFGFYAKEIYLRKNPTQKSETCFR